MKIGTIIQHVTSILSFLVGVVFGIMHLFGATIVINQADVNSIIFGLGSVTATIIQLVPFVIKVVRDKNYKEIVEIVKDVVHFAENLTDLTGPEKKEKALQIIETICKERGIAFDINVIDGLIEAAVELYNKVVK